MGWQRTAGGATANKMRAKYLIGLERRFERRLGKLGVRFKLPFEL